MTSPTGLTIGTAFYGYPPGARGGQRRHQREPRPRLAADRHAPGPLSSTSTATERDVRTSSKTTGGRLARTRARRSRASATAGFTEGGEPYG